MQITAAMVKELRERTGAGMMECKQALVDENGDLEAAVENLRKKGQAKADKKAGRIAAEGIVALAIDDSGQRGALVELNCETDFVAKKDEFRSFAQAVAAGALAEEVRDVEVLADLPLEAGGGESIEERRRELVMQLGENVSLRRVAVMEASGDRLGAYVHGGRIGVLVDVRGGDAELAKDVAMHVAASRPLAVDESDMPPGVLEKEREILLAQVADSGKPPEIREKMVTGRLKKYLSETTLLGQPFVKDPDRSVKQHLEAAGASVAGFLRFEVGEGIERKSESFAEEVMAQVRAREEG